MRPSSTTCPGIKLGQYGGLFRHQRPPGNSGQALDEVRMIIERGDSRSSARTPRPAHELRRQRRKDLEMVGEELHRTTSTSARLGSDLGHQSATIGLHPFAGLVAGTLPTEGPVPIRQPGFAATASAVALELGEVVRLLLGDRFGRLCES